jgi:phosphoribosylformylglycinamidine synthase
MKYNLKIEVKLKPGHIDPESETTENLLRDLQYKVDRVNISKVYYITLETNSKMEAKNKAKEMSNRLLANPTKDNYTILVKERK